MKKLILIPCLFLGLTLSAESISYSDSVNVISSEPIFKTVTTRTPYQECWDEEVTTSSSDNSPIGALIGGVAGGILGNQVGGGSGKTAATVGGAIVGTLVGDNLSKRGNTPSSSMQRRCVTKYQEKSAEKLVGYKNIATYKGKTITKYSNRQLDTIHLSISVHY
ncbi:glycine zipper 2TM domain-containing protein [Sulfurospirillum arcachonense]|uniref:glycine zipper 2TM domain-containing protein n=1 Tax=Sulfurospirillum arcachonense TaxID=57666 RepID=UPI00046900D2|nr:glycine zipper 2TM domain-containing protein [Sulfurospirillum arcachonense]